MNWSGMNRVRLLAAWALVVVAGAVTSAQEAKAFYGEVSDSQCALNVHSLTRSHHGHAWSAPPCRYSRHLRGRITGEMDPVPEVLNADVAGARCCDSRFHRRIRLLARLDALEEILHVSDRAVAKAVFGEHRDSSFPVHAFAITQSRCGRASRVASVPRNSRPPSSMDEPSCPRTPRRSRDSGTPPAPCRGSPTARKIYLSPSICASRGWSAFIAQCTTSIQCVKDRSWRRRQSSRTSASG
jgi:hypothetical protein